MSSATGLAALLALPLLLAGPTPVQAVELESFSSDKSLILRADETNTGDVYFMGANVDISGTQNGDLLGLAQATVISGQVNGDVAFGGESMDIRGTVTDTVRYFGSSLTITGTIEGDLLAFGNQISMHPRARVTGNVYLFCSIAVLDGTIGGNLTATAGKVSLGGTVGRDVKMEADSIDIDESAQIQGDLVYTSRKQLDPNSLVGVQGEVTYEEEVDEPDDEEEDEGFTTGSLAWSIWRIASSLLIGFVGLGLFRHAVPAITDPMERETMLGVLIGFGTSLIVPAASALAIVLIISLPLGVVTLILFTIAVYLAKLPVALWLGRRVLQATGQSAPSHYLALTLGVIVLYGLFLIPFYVGTFVWLLSTWLGLGAMVLALRNRSQGGSGDVSIATASVAQPGS